MTTRHLAFAAACSFGLAVASLVIAHEPVYDAWAWLVWGRELAALQLDTSSGPSFKPLPVAITTLLSLTGDGAPSLWLVLIRAAWLLAPVLAASLALRLTADLERRVRLAAAAFAAISLPLLVDGFTTWGRQGAAGMSEPLLVALVLGAAVAAIDRRSRAALALAGLAALIRPEVWPLLGAYGIWCWRAEPALRPWLAALAFAVPALWIGPDLVTAGDATRGGEGAVRGGGAPVPELLEVLGRAAAMPLLVVWPLALFALSRRSGATSAALWPLAPFAPSCRSTATSAALDRALGILASAAIAWVAIVAIMAAAGFPGLPRFMTPAVAMIGVIAAVGLARWLALAGRARAAAASEIPRGGRARGAAAFAFALLVLLALELPGRIVSLPRAMAITARIAHSHDDLRALADEIGRDRLLRCGRLATSDVLVRTALAWELRVPLRDVVSFGALPTSSGAFVVGPQASPLLRSYLRGHADLLGTRGDWSVYSIACAPAPGAAISSSSASVRSAGVSGATL